MNLSQQEFELVQNTATNHLESKLCNLELKCLEMDCLYHILMAIGFILNYPKIKFRLFQYVFTI